MTRLTHAHESSADPDREWLYVAFGEKQVAVGVADRSLLGRLQSTFRFMLTLTPDRIVSRLRVVPGDRRYQLFVANTCAVTRRSYDELYPFIVRGVVEQFIHARPDLIWLHAGGVAHANRGIVFVGPWGHGKSTLVMRLHAQGWAYLSDDVLVLDPRTSLALPFPLTPRVREASTKMLPRGQSGSLRKVTVELQPDGVCRHALPLGGIIFPQYKPQAETELIPYSPAAAAAELLQSCLSYVKHRETAVRTLCDLVQRVPIWRLTFADSQRAAEMVRQAAIAFV